MRRIDLWPVLQDQLATDKAGVLAEPDGRVFGTAKGRPMNASNIRTRLLAPAVERANKNLAKAQLVPLPEGLTPHKLRHTYTSLLVALGTDPGVMMDQLGHTDPGFRLRVYRHSMRRDEHSKDDLRALMGVERSGTGEVSGTNRENKDSSSVVGSGNR